MKLTFVSCLTKNCGIGRYTDELAKELHKSGHPVTVYRKEGGTEPYVQGYPYRSLRSLRHHVAPYYLSKAISSIDSHIFHADYVDAATALTWEGKKMKKARVFTTVHDAIPFHFPGSWLDQKMYKYHLKNAAKISEKLIVVSDQSKEDLADFTGISTEKIEVIYNGINHDHFFPDAEKHHNQVFTIRYLGGLGAPHKNTEALIRTAYLLEQKGAKFALEIAGGGYSKTMLPQLIRDLKVKSVKFIGFVPDHQIRQFMAHADVFLYPSLYEGFGFPPLEAMACGTPTISSNAGSLGEVLAGGAWTMDPDPEAFAEAIFEWMTHPYHLEAWRKRGIERAREFTWQRAAQETLQLYGIVPKPKPYMLHVV